MTTNTEKMDEDGRSGASAPSGCEASPSAAISVASSQSRIPNAWRPIETAPKDGSIILVRQWPWAPFHAYWRFGEWHSIEYHGSSFITHWMPRQSRGTRAFPASAIDARQRQDNEDWPDPKGESAVAKPDAQGEPR